MIIKINKNKLRVTAKNTKSFSNGTRTRTRPHQAAAVDAETVLRLVRAAVGSVRDLPEGVDDALALALTHQRARVDAS